MPWPPLPSSLHSDAQAGVIPVLWTVHTGHSLFTSAQKNKLWVDQSLNCKNRKQMFGKAHWELEKAQLLRALAALVVDPDSVPSINMVFTTICTSSFRVS